MCMLGVGDLCLGPSGDLGLISMFTCQGSKWQSPGDSVLIMMEPSQPLTGWVTLGKLPLSLGFPIGDMKLIIAPAS